MEIVVVGRKSAHPPFRKGGLGGIWAIFATPQGPPFPHIGAEKA
jgi:hypothetical protein